MIDAIVYISNSGYTKKYAEMLSKEIKLKCYSFDESLNHLQKGASVIFLDWFCGGKLVDFKKVKKRYELPCVCGVGIIPPNDKDFKKYEKKYKSKEGKFFYLRGGFALTKLSGKYHFIMKNVCSKEIFRLEMQEKLNERDAEYLKILKHGGTFVSLQNLLQVIEYVKNLIS